MTIASGFFSPAFDHALANNPELLARIAEMSKRTGLAFFPDTKQVFFNGHERFVIVPVHCFFGTTPQPERRFFATFQLTKAFDFPTFQEFGEFAPDAFQGPFFKTFFANFFRFPIGSPAHVRQSA